MRPTQLVKKVKRSIEVGVRKKSAKLLAKDNNCSDRRSIRRVIHDDLGFKTYRKLKAPALTEPQIERRLAFSRWVRKHFDHESCQKICFSDEKMFDANGQINPKNDVIYAPSRSSANKLGGLSRRRKYPLKVMVWCMVTWNGPSRVVVLPARTSYNSDFYARKVIPVVEEECARLMGEDFIYQQDGASCHTSQMSIEALENREIRYIEPHHWPPNSPDLNPLDYFFWSEVSKRVSVKRSRTRKELVTRIKRAVKEIPLENIRDSIRRFRSRVHEVEQNKGGLIQNLV